MNPALRHTGLVCPSLSDLSCLGSASTEPCILDTGEPQWKENTGSLPEAGSRWSWWSLSFLVVHLRGGGEAGLQTGSIFMQAFLVNWKKRCPKEGIWISKAYINYCDLSSSKEISPLGLILYLFLFLRGPHKTWLFPWPLPSGSSQDPQTPLEHREPERQEDTADGRAVWNCRESSNLSWVIFLEKVLQVKWCRLNLV